MTPMSLTELMELFTRTRSAMVPILRVAQGAPFSSALSGVNMPAIAPWSLQAQQIVAECAQETRLLLFIFEAYPNWE